MSFNYDLTAVQILKILDYTEPVGKDAITSVEIKNNFKLPSELSEFLSLTTGSPLFRTSDIWVDKKYFLRLLYDDIQELIDEDKDYWEENPSEYADNEYYQLYKLPKEEWGSRVPNYLLIGGDYGAGVSQMGIRLDELKYENSPVYINIEGDSLADWKILDEHLSDFLMRIICDVLCCCEYDTAARELGKTGWTSAEVKEEDLSDINMEALLKQKSMYGGDTRCGCAYDEEKNLLLCVKIDRDDSRNSKIMTYQKENA